MKKKILVLSILIVLASVIGAGCGQNKEVYFLEKLVYPTNLSPIEKEKKEERKSEKRKQRIREYARSNSTPKDRTLNPGARIPIVKIKF